MCSASYNSEDLTKECMGSPNAPESNVHLHQATPATSLAPVAIMDASASGCQAEASERAYKGMNPMRFAAAKNSFKINLMAKIDESTKVDESTNSNIVTLKVPSYKESLRNLEKTQCRHSHIPVGAGTSIEGDTTCNYQQDTVLMSKNRYIAWLLEDPDPEPPTHHQVLLPSRLTKFKYSGLYNTRDCMWGCSGPPPGTGCPVCNPVDFGRPLGPFHPQWDGI